MISFQKSFSSKPPHQYERIRKLALPFTEREAKATTTAGQRMPCCPMPVHWLATVHVQNPYDMRPLTEIVQHTENDKTATGLTYIMFRTGHTDYKGHVFVFTEPKKDVVRLNVVADNDVVIYHEDLITFWFGSVMTAIGKGMRLVDGMQ